jgi:7-cyano-7-deazaguanine synthase
MAFNKKTALVVLSGGQDSITCLGWALTKFRDVRAISFDYGQRHGIELECARKVCEDFGVPLATIDIKALGAMVTTNLVGEGDVGEAHSHNADLPASFVPCRNATMLTLAHAYAQEIGAQVLVTGVCQTDYSGYPDCRDAFIRKLEDTLNTGYLTSIRIMTPLMHKTKAETFALAEEVGFLDVVIEESHTCYLGDRDHKHDWGYGCGECPACVLRAKGWAEYNIQGAK